MQQDWIERSIQAVSRAAGPILLKTAYAVVLYAILRAAL